MFLNLREIRPLLPVVLNFAALVSYLTTKTWDLGKNKSAGNPSLAPSTAIVSYMSVTATRVMVSWTISTGFTRLGAEIQKRRMFSARKGASSQGTMVQKVPYGRLDT
jgi:hypothetical protein